MVSLMRALALLLVLPTMAYADTSVTRPVPKSSSRPSAKSSSKKGMQYTFQTRWPRTIYCERFDRVVLEADAKWANWSGDHTSLRWLSLPKEKKSLSIKDLAHGGLTTLELQLLDRLGSFSSSSHYLGASLSASCSQPDDVSYRWVSRGAACCTTYVSWKALASSSSFASANGLQRINSASWEKDLEQVARDLLEEVPAMVQVGCARGCSSVLRGVAVRAKQLVTSRWRTGPTSESDVNEPGDYVRAKIVTSSGPMTVTCAEGRRPNGKLSDYSCEAELEENGFRVEAVSHPCEGEGCPAGGAWFARTLQFAGNGELTIDDDGISLSGNALDLEPVRAD